MKKVSVQHKKVSLQVFWSYTMSLDYIPLCQVSPFQASIKQKNWCANGFKRAKDSKLRKRKLSVARVEATSWISSLILLQMGFWEILKDSLIENKFHSYFTQQLLISLTAYFVYFIVSGCDYKWTSRERREKSHNKKKVLKRKKGFRFSKLFLFYVQKHGKILPASWFWVKIKYAWTHRKILKYAPFTAS